MGTLNWVGGLDVAVKKSELYRTLWDSCDKLRGGMDASQYKDYVLVLLFMKYVTDRAKNSRNALIHIPEGGGFDDLVALKGKSNIGDGINKVINKLAEANELQGVIDVADFDDPSKLGNGKAMVDRLSGLIGIFQDPNLDFSSNQADGDDLLGDAYEYLMMKFATESGKSKGQFYTPAEVSRIMAAIIGIDHAQSQKETIYDPTCGSGSLLLKAHDLAKTATGLDLAIYGQEMDNATAKLARMNMWLHNAGTAEIENDNTLSNPRFRDAKSGGLRTFNYVVANPPFSTKSWRDGVDVSADPFFRFAYGTPPAKNGDFAFLLHILASMKSTGKAAVILPHGVLFRGNSEAAIRRALVKQGFIKAIIGLPENLFYGTPIAACIILLDKEGAAARDKILMVEASQGFVKSGAKNRLRERDVHRIVSTVTSAEEIDSFSRLVPIDEIEDPMNDFNLNLSRYITSSESEDLQDLDAHLNGGIPDRDIDALSRHWSVLPKLRAELFESAERSGYSTLTVPTAELAPRIAQSAEYRDLSAKAVEALQRWIASVRPKLTGVDKTTRPKELVSEASESLLAAFRSFDLVDEYGIYQGFMELAANTLLDDLQLISEHGWLDPAALKILPPRAKGEKRAGRVDFTIRRVDYRSELIPPELLRRRFFSDESDASSTALESSRTRLEELEATYGGDGMLLASAANDGSFTKSEVTEALRDTDEDAAEYEPLREVLTAIEDLAEAKALVKQLDNKTFDTYGELDETTIRAIVVDDKWIGTVESVLEAELRRVAGELIARLKQLEARYRSTVSELEDDIANQSRAVKDHLRSMGLSW